MTLPLFSAEHVAVTEARASEYHPTPSDVVGALLRGMREAGHAPLPLGGHVRESAAGAGALVQAVNILAPSNARLWTLHELRPDACAGLRSRFPGCTVIEGDFLADPAAHEHVETDVTNPPWSRALEWAEAALQTTDHLALHVPLATVETPERAAFFRRHPADLYPLEWRPDYDGRGTVSRAVCWIVWGPGRGGRWFPLTRSEAS